MALALNRILITNKRGVKLKTGPVAKIQITARVPLITACVAKRRFPITAKLVLASKEAFTQSPERKKIPITLPTPILTQPSPPPVPDVGLTAPLRKGQNLPQLITRAERSTAPAVKMVGAPPMRQIESIAPSGHLIVVVRRAPV